jgi:hypothetical protein
MWYASGASEIMEGILPSGEAGRFIRGAENDEGLAIGEPFESNVRTGNSYLQNFFI